MKSFNPFFILTVFSVSLLSASTFANHGELSYLHEMSVDTTLFPAPPLEGSYEDNLDLMIVRNFQKTRTKQECDRANYESNCSIKGFFGAPYGPLKIKQYELVEQIYLKIFKETDFFVYALKDRWNRNRPYVRDPSIKLCVNSHAASSYPSGHTAISRSTARILGLIFPQYKTSLLKRADQIAYDRVMAGVHHPSDIKAGKKLGDKVATLLMENPDFRAEVAQLKKQALTLMPHPPKKTTPKKPTSKTISQNK